jgi:hypothetical protein
MSDMKDAIAFGKKMGNDLGKIYTPVGKEGFKGIEEEVALGNKMAEDFKKNAGGKI